MLLAHKHTLPQCLLPVNGAHDGLNLWLGNKKLVTTDVVKAGEKNRIVFCWNRRSSKKQHTQ